MFLCIWARVGTGTKKVVKGKNKEEANKSES